MLILFSCVDRRFSESFCNRWRARGFLAIVFIASTIIGVVVYWNKQKESKQVVSQRDARVVLVHEDAGLRRIVRKYRQFSKKDFKLVNEPLLEPLGDVVLNFLSTRSPDSRPIICF